MHWKIIHYYNSNQCAKKVMTDSPGLMDFALRLVNFVLLPDRQVKFFKGGGGGGDSNCSGTVTNIILLVIFKARKCYLHVCPKDQL